MRVIPAHGPDPDLAAWVLAAEASYVRRWHRPAAPLTARAFAAWWDASRGAHAPLVTLGRPGFGQLLSRMFFLMNSRPTPVYHVELLPLGRPLPTPDGDP